MTIDPIGTSSTDNSTSILAAEVATLAPADVLEYVRSRLFDIDGQMRGYMDDAERNRKKSEDLGEYQKFLTGLDEGGDGYDMEHHSGDSVTRADATDGKAQANANVIDQINALQKKVGPGPLYDKL
jgi:hypothetical protein